MYVLNKISDEPRLLIRAFCYWICVSFYAAVHISLLMGTFKSNNTLIIASAKAYLETMRIYSLVQHI